jgi:hypothetical protein
LLYGQQTLVHPRGAAEPGRHVLCIRAIGASAPPAQTLTGAPPYSTGRADMDLIYMVLDA